MFRSTHPALRPSQADLLKAGGLALLFTLIYGLLWQENINGSDTAWLIRDALYYAQPRILPHHVIYVPLLYGFIKGGALLGIPTLFAGIFLSALTMGLAIGCYFLLLRGLQLPGWIALSVCVAFGLSQATIENGTSLEIYGVSMLCVALNFYCFMLDYYDRERVPSWLFPLSGALVIGAHLGFAAWPCSLLLTLRLCSQGQPRFARRAIHQGLWMVAMLLVMVALIPPQREDSFGLLNYFATAFWQKRTGLGIPWRIMEAVLTDLHAYAGLTMVPAIIGARLCWRERRAFALHAALLTALFLGYYSFWVVDLGSFYLPVQLAWGVFAALGIQALAQMRRGVALLLGLALPHALFLLPFQPPLQGMFHAHWLKPLVLLFWGWLIAQWVLAPRLQALSGHAPGTAARSISWRWLYPLAVVALSLLLYFPRVLPKRRLPEDHFRIAALCEAAPAPAPRGARLLTDILPALRAFAQGGYDPMSYHAPDVPAVEWYYFDVETFVGWLEDTRPPKSMPLYLDEPTHARFIASWDKWHTRHPLAALELRPFERKGFKFYQVTLKP